MTLGNVHAARLSTLWLRVLVLLAVGGMVAATPAKFLIVSSPREGRVAYMRVQHSGGIKKAAVPADAEMKELIGTGLIHPQGLAVQQLRQLLLVADPDARKVWAYPLKAKFEELLVGDPILLADNVEARWVAVDSTGNIFFSDEAGSRILKISRDEAVLGNSTPIVEYDGAVFSQVSAPGGLALDSFHAYWVNKQGGTKVGSVIRGPGQRLGRSLVQLQDRGNLGVQRVVPLAMNTDKSYGLCLAMNNVYYTQPDAVVFGIKKTGSDPVMVTNRLKNPRGCVWDGDGTVYVADRGAGAVYSFAGDMKELSAAQISKTVDFEDAFGVAVFSVARPRCVLSAAVLVAALLLRIVN